MKLTIVTTTFNSQKYFEETIVSILKLNSTVIDLEYIVVDAGSTDGTLDIVAKYPGIKLFSYPKSSMYEAIDFGFRKAKGDIIAWLNSDDVYYENVLESILKVFEQKHVGIVTGNTTYIDENSEKLYSYSFPFMFKWYLRSESTLFLVQPSTFFLKDLYFEVGGFDLNLKYNADRDLILRMLAKADIQKIKYLISKFRVHGNNFSTLKKKDMEEEDKYIDSKLSVGKKSRYHILAKILSLITKLNNPAMIVWKLRNRKVSTF